MRFINPDFINTYDSYSGEILFGNGYLIIPYINVNLLKNNPINNNSCFVDYSYFIFRKIVSLEFGSESSVIKATLNVNSIGGITKYISVGGYGKGKGAEIMISFKESVFITLDTSSIKEGHFIPVDTPNFKSNMRVDEVDLFFANKMLPKDISQLLGDSFYRIII